MPPPRVFVSSPERCLRTIRRQLSDFILSLGFHPVLAEQGDVSYSPWVHPEASCYTEIQHCHLCVVVIAQEYGKPAKHFSKQTSSDRRYISVTRAEWKIARERGIPICVFVRRSVYAKLGSPERVAADPELQNITDFLREVDTLTHNNTLFTFSAFSDIEQVLRKQWAGMFSSFLENQQSDLQKQSQAKDAQKQNVLSDILAKRSDLYKQPQRKPVNKQNTVRDMLPRSKGPILSKKELRLEREIMRNRYVILLHDLGHLAITHVVEAIGEAQSLDDFARRVRRGRLPKSVSAFIPPRGGLALSDFNKVRRSLRRSPLNT